jgi:hypothetical protein
MARTKLDAVGPNLVGAPVVIAAPNAQGDAVRPRTALLVTNSSGAPITITLTTAGTHDGYAVADPTVTLAAGASTIIGGFTSVFPQPSGADEGWVYVDYSSITGVTRTCLALGA